MVNTKMDKKINNLEGALNVFQKQMEERDQRFTDFQSSMGAILSRIEARLDAHDQNPGRGNLNLDREGASGLNEMSDDASGGLCRVRNLDLWRKLEIPLF